MSVTIKDRKVEIIFYELVGDECATFCPHKAGSKAGSLITGVHSISCQHCDYFVGKLEEKNSIACAYRWEH